MHRPGHQRHPLAERPTITADDLRPHALLLATTTPEAERRWFVRAVFGGRAPALRTLARRSAVPVDLTSDIAGTLPAPVELAAYYVVAESLTNAAKHARAEAVAVRAETRDGWLRLRVTDDGAGGADARGGSGLVGLADRVAALGGRLRVTSPRGDGTTVAAELPLTQWVNSG